MKPNEPKTNCPKPMTLEGLLRDANSKGVPLVFCPSHDGVETIHAALDTLSQETNAFLWDCISGAQKLKGAENLSSEEDAADALDFLILCQEYPPNTISFFQDAHKFWNEVQVVRMLLKIREQYKQNNRTLVLVTKPGALPPPELAASLMTLPGAMPGQDQLSLMANEIIGSNYGEGAPYNKTEQEASEDAESAARVLSGLTSFAAEQSLALSLQKEGVNFPLLWKQKKEAVEATKGLGFSFGEVDPGSIGGLEQIKRFAAQISSGPQGVRGIVFIDEIEKMMPNNQDSSGVSQDALGTMLRTMQDNEWDGLLAVGFPGSGKSMIAKAFGAICGVPTISLDLGAMKGGIVGESEANLRRAISVIEAITGKGGAFFIATANDISSLRPELVRRFGCGRWFFDLPSKEERQAIWQIHTKKHGLPDGGWAELIDDGWTGAEIATCCNLAWRLSLPLAGASEYIIPYASANQKAVQALREQAAGRYLCASRPGAYQLEEKSEGKPSTRRRISTQNG